MSSDDPAAPLPEEIQAEAILSKVDALLSRHGRSGRGLGMNGTSPQDDLPVLTEVCEAAPAAAPVDAGPDTLFPERLISLDTLLARELESWFRQELPPLLAREIELLTPRIQEAAIGHLRATLLPRLSEAISAHLDGIDDLPVLQQPPAKPGG